MIVRTDLKKYLEESTENIKINFYYKCFNTVIDPNYNYNDCDNQFIDGFYLDNGSVIYYANIYFDKYASDDLKKQYLNNSVLSKQLEIKDEYSKIIRKKEKLEYIYNWCLKANWSAKRLIPVGMALNISTNNIIKKGIKYAIENLGIPKEELRETLKKASLINMQEFYNNSKYNNVFNEIYKESDKDKVVKILEKNQVIVSEMLYRVNFFVKLYGDILDKNKSSKEIKDLLIEKIKYYANYKIEMTKKNNEYKKKLRDQEKFNLLVKNANSCIEKLIIYIYNNQNEGDAEKIENNFCIDNDINKKKLRKYKKVVKEYNKKLYTEYFNAIQKINNLRKNKILFTCLNLKDILIHDPLYEETKSSIKPSFSFNSIDYYELFDIPLNELYQKVSDIIPKLDINDVKLIKIFTFPYYLKENMSLSYADIRLILNEVKEKRCEKDENGLPISGTGIILTREEKMQILDFLKENNIPGINKNIYKDACERYMDGKLLKSKYKTRKLGKK